VTCASSETSIALKLKKAFSKYKLNKGKKVTYDYCWHIKEKRHTNQGQGDSIFGFKTMGIFIPEKDIHVLVRVAVTATRQPMQPEI
jgi:hypothetical protein